MSDSDTDPLGSLLSSFALGPSWARAAGDTKERKSKGSPRGGDDRPPRRDDRDRDGGGRPRPPGGDRRRNESFGDRSAPPPREQYIEPAEGVEVTISPDRHAVHLIGKEVHQVARVYPLFDVAKILLAEKARLRVIFEAHELHPPLIKGKLEDSVFLTRAEAIRHLWNSKLRAELLEEETIEVDPPKGNFQVIARCGISGEWLGPVNFHGYQTNLRQLHRERYARMPFELYAAKVRTERGEEAVNAWLETTKNKTRWRIKGDDDEAWMDDRAAAERALGERCFDQAFEETRVADVSGTIAPENLSPTLFASLRMAGTHARNHPALLIPAVCRAVESEHLPVFKRKGKLHTGPARPQPLPANAVLAERPGQMVNWIRENPPAKLEGLWRSVLPEGSTAPPAEYAADLFWLLHQGHILLFTDDTLVVQEARETTPPKPEGEKKKRVRKRKKKKSDQPGSETAAEASSDTATPKDPTSAAETPTAADPQSAPAGDISPDAAISAEATGDGTTSKQPAADPSAPTEQPAPTEPSATSADPAPVISTEIPVVPDPQTAPAGDTSADVAPSEQPATETPAAPAAGSDQAHADHSASADQSAPVEQSAAPVEQSAPAEQPTEQPISTEPAAEPAATAAPEAASESENPPSLTPEKPDSSNS